MLKDLKKRAFGSDSIRIMEKIVKESETGPFYYDIHLLTKRMKKQVPKTDVLIEKLQEKGFGASKTHFSPISIKTDAKMKDLRTIVHC